MFCPMGLAFHLMYGPITYTAGMAWRGMRNWGLASLLMGIYVWALPVGVLGFCDYNPGINFFIKVGMGVQYTTN